MAYVGGKHRIRKEVADIITHECALMGVREVWEPFCGGLYVTAELGRRGYSVHASDLSAPLVCLYKALRLGWSPPTALSRTRWDGLKQAHARAVTHPLIGFAGFCASFNTVFFASYAPQQMRSNSKTLRERVRSARFASLRCTDYDAVTPPPGSVVYCDPPYAETDLGAYRSLPKDMRHFDSAAFWVWARARQAEGTTVVVSEYSAPSDVPCVWAKDLTVLTASHTGDVTTARDAVYLLRADAKTTPYRGTP